MFEHDQKPEWSEKNIICHIIDGAKVVTTRDDAGFPYSGPIEVYWGEHDGEKWLYACDDMFSLGHALRNLGFSEPNYRHRATLNSLKLSAQQSAVTLLATFSTHRASGADRIADALGLFVLLTTTFGFSARAVEFALARLEGFSSCKARIQR